jgi:hypothetical protein
MNVPNESYSKNASCALNYKSSKQKQKQKNNKNKHKKSISEIIYKAMFCRIEDIGWYY